MSCNDDVVNSPTSNNIPKCVWTEQKISSGKEENCSAWSSCCPEKCLAHSRHLINIYGKLQMVETGASELSLEGHAHCSAVDSYGNT